MAFSQNDPNIKSRIDRLHLLAVEVRRWAEMYQTVYAAMIAERLATPSILSDADIPRPDQVAKISGHRVADIARRYLDATSPNCGTPSDVRGYIESCTGISYTPSAVGSALKKLVREGHVRPVTERGRYRSTKASSKKPQQNAAKPEINPEGLRNEVRRLVLIHGPLQAKTLIELVCKNFSMSGNTVDNFYTIISKTSDIRFLKSVGFYRGDLIDLYPIAEGEIHRRYGGSKRLKIRGLAKAKLNRAGAKAPRDEDRDRP